MAECRFEHRSTASRVHALMHRAMPHSTLDHRGLPHWVLSKSIGSEAQDVTSRRDMHGDRSHPKADSITKQLDFHSGWPASGVAKYRLEPSPRVLWMSFNGQEKNASHIGAAWCLLLGSLARRTFLLIILNSGSQLGIIFSPYPWQGIFGKSLETCLVVTLRAAAGRGGTGKREDATGIQQLEERLRTPLNILWRVALTAKNFLVQNADSTTARNPKVSLCGLVDFSKKMTHKNELCAPNLPRKGIA